MRKNNKLLLKRKPCIDNLTLCDIVTKVGTLHSEHFVPDLGEGEVGWIVIMIKRKLQTVQLFCLFAFFLWFYL